MDLSNKRALVVGLGRSGRAASVKLKLLGARVLASDISESDDMVRLAGELRANGIDVKLGRQDESLINGIDLVVVSPGVPSWVPVIRVARAANVPIWSEIELAYRLTGKPIIAITGTNGKTTTTTMIGKVFEAAGRPAAVAGNIGMPLVSAIDDEGIEMLIVEVSSFQLDTIVDFKPETSVLLNITEDHLDWHSDFEDYIRAKKRLFLNQSAGDLAVLNIDDDIIRSFIPDIKAKIIKTSKQGLEKGIFVKEGRIVAKLQTDADICGISELKIRGSHNLDNVMAVIGVCLAAGIDAETIRQTIKEFPGLNHRIEYVASINGISYYNDSKATNIDATAKALTAFSEPVILLVGGRNKGNNFASLAQNINEQVKAVIGFGEAGREILNVMPPDIPREYAETVDSAVALAGRLAQPGYVVLFSPSCASFDAFNSYAQRGDAFKEAVLGLGEANGEGKN
ncbi:MAG: UDP-N-acetylmuramoyl-L-alanine--D-glutamate ligase [Actinobacteria bacterium]|nr:UDP-N-acetylmuramoyl-L-alanine--D-glutamate ligase [Actinomycetota bacterium]